MALPSQNVGSVRSRTHMYRRSRRRPLRAAIGIVAALALTSVVAWWLWPGGGDGPGEGGDGGEIAANTAARAEDRLRAPAGDPAGGVAPDVRPASAQRSADDAITERDGDRDRGGRTTPAPDAFDRAAAEAERERERERDRTGSRDARDGPSAATPATGARLEGPRRPTEPAPLTADQVAATHEAQAAIDLIPTDPVRARLELSRIVRAGRLSADNDAFARRWLERLGDRLVFSREIVEGDPYAREYRVKDNDAMSMIPRREKLATEWQLIARINEIDNPARIHRGQRLKLLTGPFHAVVVKQSYELELWMGDPEDPVFVRSFPVGLGKDNGTPTGSFTVKRGSKLIDPAWTNPLDGTHYRGGDPENPIGKYWVGIIGDDPDDPLVGYGIHGTIDPESIGRSESMGCVRMADADIELVWELLTYPGSRIVIRER